MTDETRILRTVGIPAIIGLILLFAMPKMCMRAVVVSKARQEQAPRASGGLHIESSQKPVVFPAALDADRLRYLIELDPGFAAPASAQVMKNAAAISSPQEQLVLAALLKRGYVEQSADRTLTLTRDALLHLEGVTDDGTSLSFPLARREFRTVTAVENEADVARIRFAWQWHPTSAGEELIPSPRRHESIAVLSGGSGRWSLVQINGMDDTLQ